MNKYNIEKSLKRYLKKKIGYSVAIFVFFMINGSISLSADVNTEVNIQQLLRDIKIEKNLLEENILEIEKKISSIENLKYKDQQVFFSILLEGRKSHNYSDNGFSSKINEDNDKNENIDIPDLISPIRPDIPVIKNPLPNEEQIVKVPSFEFESIGKIEVNIPNEIELSFENLNLPVNEIKDENFNILDGNNISTPIMSDDEISIDVTNPDIDINIKTEIVRPEINNVNELLTFEIPEIEVEVGDIIVPESFSMSTVKIKTGSFEQRHNTDYVTTEEADGTYGRGDFYILQNFLDYSTEKNVDGTEIGLNVWVHRDGIYYDTDNDNKYILLKGPNGEDIRLGHAWDNKQTGGFANHFGNNFL